MTTVVRNLSLALFVATLSGPSVVLRLSAYGSVMGMLLGPEVLMAGPYSRLSELRWGYGIPAGMPATAMKLKLAVAAKILHEPGLVVPSLRVGSTSDC